jgi:hypothetical protein
MSSISMSAKPSTINYFASSFCLDDSTAARSMTQDTASFVLNRELKES